MIPPVFAVPGGSLESILKWTCSCGILGSPNFLEYRMIIVFIPFDLIENEIEIQHAQNFDTERTPA